MNWEMLWPCTGNWADGSQRPCTSLTSWSYTQGVGLHQLGNEKDFNGHLDAWLFMHRHKSIMGSLVVCSSNLSLSDLIWMAHQMCELATLIRGRAHMQKVASWHGCTATAFPASGISVVQAPGQAFSCSAVQMPTSSQ